MKLVTSHTSTPPPVEYLLKDLPPGVLAVTNNPFYTAQWTVFKGKKGDVIFLDDGDIFYADTPRLLSSTLRVILLPKTATVTLTNEGV